MDTTTCELCDKETPAYALFNDQDVTFCHECGWGTPHPDFE